MKSKKNEELNFLYLDDKYTNNKKKKKTSKTSKKQSTKKAKAQKENEVFNFDNEIVIGVTKIQNKQDKKNNAKTTQNKNKKAPSKTVKKEKNKGADKKSALKNKNKKIQVKKQKVESKKNTFLKNLIKWTILLSALVASFIFFMMSPLFNVIEITVTGNNSISKETIISLSEINIGDNILKTSKEKIREKIKQNAYIESVEVKRTLPNKIELVVKERNTTYMLEYLNGFAYINNQGYILEISNQNLDVPIITGYFTKQEQLQAGNRLNEEDLIKLETVLKISESIKVNEISNKIIRIDISDKQDYILYLEENKTIYLGDASNLSSRMLYLKAMLNDTKGLEGEIFINGDLVKEKAFFRQKE